MGTCSRSRWRPVGSSPLEAVGGACRGGRRVPGGWGTRTEEVARNILAAGAEDVVVGTAAVWAPKAIARLGTAVVAVVDVETVVPSDRDGPMVVVRFGRCWKRSPPPSNSRSGLFDPISATSAVLSGFILHPEATGGTLSCDCEVVVAKLSLEMG